MAETNTISQRALRKLRAATTPTGCTRPDTLFGAWLVEPQRFNELVLTAKSVDLVALAQSKQAKADGAPGGPLPTLSPESPGKKKAKSEDEVDDDSGDMAVDPSVDDPDDDDDDDDSDDPMIDEDDAAYQVINGIAVFSINGPMTKYQTSFQSIFGGTATVPLRRALRMAANDPDVMCGILCIDSPGGTAAGMTDLAADIRAFNAAKPCYGYIQDMGCSAAYWAASQCRKVYANAGALVGCIGTMMVLRDTSKAYEQQGVQVHVITSDAADGDTMKGAGADGAPLTADQLADFKRLANEQNDLFVADVAAGRKMTPDRVRAMADGRVHVGAKAQALGLVDEISSLDSAMQAIYMENLSMTTESFRAFAAANPEDQAVKSLIAQGHKAGKAEGVSEARKDLATMLAAFPGREKFAAEQFVKGHDAISAKAELADVLTAELADANKKLSERSQAAAAAANDSPAITLPLPGTTQGAAKGNEQPADPIATFEAAWKALEKTGMSADRAIAKVVAEQPDLHAAYVQASQAKRRSGRRS